MVFTKNQTKFNYCLICLLRAMKGYVNEQKLTNIRKGVVLTKNQLDYWRLQEEKRHNRAVEEETARNNARVLRDQAIAKLREHQRGVQANKINAARNLQDYELRQSANQINAIHNNRYDTESERHNKEMEQLSYLSHQNELARIELTRQQLVTSQQALQNAKEIAQINAAVGYAQVGAQYANIAEQTRSHMANEALQSSYQEEVHRANLQQEAVNRAKANVDQQRVNIQRQAQNFEEGKWNSIGYASAVQHNANQYAQMNLTWAQTDLAVKQKQLAGVNATSNLIGSAGNVLRAVKGVGNGKSSPKVSWPDGSVSY